MRSRSLSRSICPWPAPGPAWPCRWVCVCLWPWPPPMPPWPPPPPRPWAEASMAPSRKSRSSEWLFSSSGSPFALTLPSNVPFPRLSLRAFARLGLPARNPRYWPQVQAAVTGVTGRRDSVHTQSGHLSDVNSRQAFTMQQMQYVDFRNKPRAGKPSRSNPTVVASAAAGSVIQLTEPARWYRSAPEWALRSTYVKDRKAEEE
jgi:hypothetical protein